VEEQHKRAIDYFLPRNFTYYFHYFESCKLHGKSGVTSDFRIKNVKTEKAFNEWLTEFNLKSGAEWRTLNSSFATDKTYGHFSYAVDLICHLSKRNKTEVSDRNLKCDSVLKVRIKKDTKNVR
jgi:hypothetical protein